MKKIGFALTLACGLGGLLRPAAAFAQPLAFDDFSYGAGNLNTKNGGTGFGGAWSETSPGSFVTDGSAVVATNASAAYANRGLTTNMPMPNDGDSAYASFKMTVLSGSPTGYVILLGAGGPNLLFGTFGGQFALQGSHVQSVSAGVEYLVVMRVTRTDGGPDPVTLWVDPSSEANTPTTSVPGTTLVSDGATGFSTLQLYATNTGSVRFDEVRYGASFADVLPPPEPIPTASEWGMLAFALLLCAMMLLITRERMTPA